MDTELLKVVGQVAGIGGLALGVFLLLFREIIRKKISRCCRRPKPIGFCNS